MKGGKVTKLKEGGGRTRILKDYEEERLYDAARASNWPQMYMFLRMVLTTGARSAIGVDLQILVLDIDLDRVIHHREDPDAGEAGGRRARDR